jgi:amino acid adenylation domain-containing protein
MEEPEVNALSLPTLRDVLQARAAEHAERRVYTFLSDSGEEEDFLTYAGLEARARAIAARLRDLEVTPGERVLLLFPPGLDFIAAFFGCLHAGAVAVPAYPPRSPRTLPRLGSIVRDARPAAVLTLSGLRPKLQALTASLPELQDARWLAVDEVGGAEGWEPPAIAADDPAFLQYTSGSTSAPKGVVVTHANLLHNEEMIRQAFGQSEESVIVGWLPLYHDMGLIGNVLQPLYCGARCILMSPMSFLQRPRLWLEAVGRYGATTSGGPNFAYELCVRKVGSQEREGLDLSSWRVAFNGAEPVRSETMERFVEAFAPRGFRREAFYPCYGLAEATLFVTGGRPGAPFVQASFEASALERHLVEESAGPGARSLVASGRPWSGQRVAVADPETGVELPSERVGEVWVQGPSVARGYWGNPEQTARTFGARLASGEGPFLRTGDLGFIQDGRLFVTGRLKDLIILRGRNHYPQDLELTAERAHPALRPGCGAAFSVDVDGEESLVVVHEVERHPGADLDEIAGAVRRAVAEEHEVQVRDVVLLRAGTLPKTSSGKVQRHACRAGYLAGGLAVVGASTLERPETEARETAPAPDRQSLAGLEAGERRSAVLRFLEDRAAALLGRRPRPDEPLTSLGLDSLKAIELKAGVDAALGVALPLPELLEGRGTGELAERIANGLVSPPSDLPRLEASPAAGDQPLTAGQKALWFLHRLAPESLAYVLGGAARLHGEIDAEVLRRAFETLVERHPALRTTFPEGPEGPVQRIAETGLELVQEEAADWEDARLLERLRAAVFQPFDLETGPLFRVTLVSRGGERWLAVSVHHIVSDFASLAVLARELGLLAAGGALEPVPLGLGDYARWEERRLAGADGERLWSWWRERLAGVPPLDLPLDRPRPPVQTYTGVSRMIHLEPGPVRSLAREHGCTPFMVLLAAFQALLGRYSSQEDFAVGTPSSLRSAEPLRDVVGYLVNPIALRADLTGEPEVGGWLGRVRRGALEAFEHRDLPFPLLAERLQPQRDPSRTPVFQAMLVFHKAPSPELEALTAFTLGEGGALLPLGGAVSLEPIALEPPGAQLDLTLTAAEKDDAFPVSLQVDAALFEPATAERMLGHFANLLGAMAADPAQRVSGLDLLSEPERRQLLEEWNAPGERVWPRDVCLHELVAGQARRTPEAEAVVAGDLRLTYAELARRAGDLAGRLSALGVGPEVRVGVSMSRSADLIVSVLGVLESGAAYVPLDPAYPRERLSYLLDDSGAAVLLTGEGTPDLAFPGPKLDVRSLPSPAGERPVPSRTEAGNLAYLIYTSGSTGRPKAVAVEHRSAVALVRWAREVFSPEELSGVLASTSLGFDLSVFEIFVPLSYGGRVILAENALELPRLAAAGEVTLVNTVPSAIAELVRGDGLPVSVRTVNLAGEPLPGELARRIYAQPSVQRVLNLYGPSEDTTYSTWAQAPGDGSAPSIGGPIAGTRAYVLDARGDLVPVGVPGELYLGGEGLARGYLGRPELTAEKFVPDPFGSGGRLYRAGDLVRRRPDGALDFLGRIDHQVKIRGFRIELGEVETALLRHPDVREAVAVAREGRLVAYVVPERETGLEPGELRAWLARSLPEAMLPTAWVVLPALPLTPNGKVDRKALPAPEWDAERPASAAPGTWTEELLAGIWSEVLGIGQPGPDDNFFDLGGHSLLAARVVSRVRSALGVELPLRALFQEPTLSGLAGRIERERQDAPASRSLALVPTPRGGELPLSFSQERLWFLERLAPGQAVYHMPAALWLRGVVDVGALERALTEVVRRHESLRTTFPEVDGRPVQCVLDGAPPAFEVVDLSGLGATETALDIVATEARRPFDLTAGPLLRVLLLRCAADEHLLALYLHHIVSDGWSMRVLLREVETLYAGFAAGRTPVLSELPVQYPDYAVWQRRWLEGEELERQLAFWRRHLAGAPEALDLPTDHSRPAIQLYRGAAEPLAWPEDLVADLRAAAHREGATLFMVVLAGFATLLSRYGGQEDLLVGTPVANRRRTEVEGLIGFFVNTLPLRVGLEGGPTSRELLARVREAALEMYAHQDVPFERLVEELRPRRDLSRSPLFQVMLALEDGALERLSLPGVDWSLVPAERLHTGTSKFELSLLLSPAASGLAGVLEIDTALFEPAAARRLAVHLGNLLRAMVTDPARPVAELDLLSDAERRQLFQWNAAGERVWPHDLRLHELFAEQARRTPEAEALVAWDQRLTYAELARRASDLAGRLRALGVGPEVRVGVSMKRSAELVVSLLAVLEAGGAYVPLDPTYPRERLSYLLEDSGASVLLTGEGAPDLAFRGPTLDVRSSSLPAAEGPVPSPTGAGNLAYLIYTSGSTGRPKAVAIEHRSAVALVRWAREVFTPEELSGVLASTSISFDLSVFELFVPLSCGGRVILAENALELPRLAAAGEVTLVNTVPSAIAELVRGGGLPPSARTVNLAGEPLPGELARRIYAQASVRRVLNLYGPSEDTTYSTWAQAPADGSSPSIGGPIAGTRAHVLDALGGLVAVGVPGELYLGGEGLARGYLGRPELTAEKFVPDPFGSGGRLYRTGDLVRRRPDGGLDFLGRIDHQVKIRGFRIELGEVEAALRRHPAVREAVAVAREDTPGDRRLVAYVVSDGETGPAELRAWLARTLPEAMLPGAWVILPALPLTPNGKVDRKALPAPERAPRPASPAVATADRPLEELLAGIWAEVLGVDQVGPGDDFFELGGHSLLAARVVSRVQTALGVELPLRTLFQETTLAGLAGRIEQARRDGSSSQAPLVPVSRDGDLPLSFSQERLWLLDRLLPSRAVYHMPAGVWLRGRLDVAALERALDEVVRRHEALRTTFPEVDGRPVQRALPSIRLPFEASDLSGAPAASEAALDVAVAGARRPFDLASGPLMRVLLLRCSPEEHLLAVYIHHIVSDGWSMRVLLQEVGALYAAFMAAEPSPLPELPVQYPDYAVWQRSWMVGEELENQLAFWRRSLAGAPEALDLPADHPRPAFQAYRGTAEPVALSGDVVADLRSVARREGATLFMVVLAGFASLLSRYSGQEDVVVGTPVANRRRAEVEGLIGFFVNTLPLRVLLEGAPSVRELLAGVREAALGAYAHQDVPFERLVEELSPRRDLSRSPLFQVMLALEDGLPEALRLPGIESSLVPQERFHTGTAKFELSLLLSPSGSGLAGVLEVDSDLFEVATARRMLGHLENLLGAFAADPSRSWSELDLLSPSERRQIFTEWSRPERRAAPGLPLHREFMAAAERAPDSVAVSGNGLWITYGELDRRTDRLARHLRRLGIGPEGLVGLCVERSPEIVVGILGILKAGGAYVPLDPDTPAERLAYLLGDSGCRVLLIERHLLGRFDETLSGRPDLAVVPLDVAHQDGALKIDEPLPDGSGPTAAYVIYTSGSTGRPKGVVVEHAQVSRLFTATRDWFGFRAGDVWTLFHSFAFDFSVWEIWGALLYGGRLVVVPYWVSRSPEAFHELLVEEGVTVLNQTPSAFRQLIQAEAGSQERELALRWVVFGGEALDLASLAPWFARHGEERPRLVNMYGITETTVHVTYRPLSAADLGEGGAAPSVIGVAIPDLRVQVLDPRKQPVPALVPGEVYVGGDGLARGYLGRPDLTAERFVPDPFGERAGTRLYRSGDLARWLSNGDLEYLGRIDHQVKIRGFRIELGEIQSVLLGHAAVRDAVVLVREDGGDRRLVGYVVPEGEGETPAGLRAALRERLPEHMVPAVFVFLAGLPLTSNGKVDRRALLRLPVERDTTRMETFAAPRTPAEELLAGIWAEVLGIGRAGRDDSFFDLGGHSLLATQVVSRVRAAFGVELPLRALFLQPTLAGLAGLIEREGSSAEAPPLAPAPRGGDLPLSFAQERLWFLDQLEPGSAAYNIPAAVRLDGRLDPGALASALTAIAARHEALRTTFVASGGRPVQVIAPAFTVELPWIDLDSLGGEARETEVRRLISQEAARPFDLARGPLLRAVLLSLGGHEHVLLLAIHHAAADGWSIGIFLRELAAFYGASPEERGPDLPALPVQYVDYAVWQRGWLSGQVLEGQLAFWRQELAGLPPALDLPLDRSRQAAAGARGASLELPLDGERWRAVEALARGESATPFMVVLAAVEVLLSRHARTLDFAVGTPIAGRNRREIEDLIGLFVNTLTLRADLSGDPDARGLLSKVRRATLAAYEHQDLPFERLVEDLAPRRDLGRSPLFQVMLAFQNAPAAPLALPGLRMTPLEVPAAASKFDLSFSLTPGADGALLRLVYRADLFEATTVARMLGHCAALLDGMARGSRGPVAELPWLAEAERRELLAGWTGDARPETLPTVHEMFSRHVERSPEAVAVVFEEGALSYGELDAQARRLACRLRALGVGPEETVGVCLERSGAMIVALLGVLQAGGSYVPLDPELPADRLAFMLDDSGARALVTGSRLAGLFPAGERPVLLLDELPEEEPEALPPGLAGPEHLAYVIYTSGSTGRPKGVGVEHRQLSAYVAAVLERMALPPGSSFATVSTIAADLGNTAVFPALCSGGALHVLSRERLADAEGMAEYFGRHDVDCLKIVPSHLSALMAGPQPGGVLPRRLLVLGGEASSWGLVDRVRELAPGCRVLNHYGPTETTVGVLTCPTWNLSDRRAPGVPLGWPLGRTRSVVVDDRLQPVPAGVPGELLVGGPQVTRGYLGRPGLTAERFVPDPFADPAGEPGARLYRTGDLVRRLPDGSLEFLGRIDQQVKIRGYRIELGEVEAALRLRPEVREVAVVVRSGSEPALAAFVVARTGADIALSVLRGWLRERLPDAMVPSEWALLDALPLNANGKVDRRALVERSAAPVPEEAALTLPRTPVEEVLAAVWSDVLGIETVSVDAGFFELGGHSLLATRLISRVRAAFGVELPLRELFEEPTVAGLAGRVEAAMRAGRTALPPLEPVSRDRPLPLSFSQRRLWLLDQILTDGAAYNIPAAVRLEGDLDAALLSAALSEIVRRHEVLRTTFTTVDGEPVQVVGASRPLPLLVVDLRALARSRREAEAGRLAREEARRRFDLSSGPVIRTLLLTLDDRESLALLTMHHIASDGWSTGVLVRELGALYASLREGRPSPLPEIRVQYADFAAWQQRWLVGEALAAELAHWRWRLAGAPMLELPTDRPRPSVKSGRGARRRLELPARAAREIEALARAQGATPFMVLLAAFQTLLGRYTGQTDVAVGAPVAGRGHTELEGLIGFFVNTLVLRTDLAGDPSFAEVLGRARGIALEAYAHQDLPFERLVEELAPERSLAHTPLFQVMFALQTAPFEPLALPGLELAPASVDNGTSKLDLALVLRPDRDAWWGEVEYDTDLFDPPTIDRLAVHFETLLAGTLADPGTRVGDLPLLSAAERHQLLADWNDTAAPREPARCVHELFEVQARSRPDAVAVEAGDVCLTYGGLADRSGGLARSLVRLGVGPESVVGLCLERSPELVVGALAVLRAGGAYLPLDPSHPDDRLTLMLADAGPAVVLTQRSLAARLSGYPAPLLALDDLEPEEPAGAPAVPVEPSGRAYVIYTSGSTGVPKGVEVSHGALMNLVGWHHERFRTTPRDRAAQLSGLSFDAAVWDLWPYLTAGAPVALPREEVRSAPEELRDWLVERQVTISFVPTAMAELLLRLEWPLWAAFETLLTGGDKLRVRPAAGLPFALVNNYGPTENAVVTVSGRVEPDAAVERAPALGRPLDNVKAYLLGPGLAPAPIGVGGELCAGGPSLARGYLGRPDLTAERFVPDPFGAPGGRLYRTGDLVRYLPDGTLEFLGRIDQQVKIRGFRIEPGEVEVTLQAHPSVAECAVVARRDLPGGEPRLVAYVVLSREGNEDAPARIAELRRWLVSSLPAYMVPSAFVLLAALPLNANGKVDRHALPTPERAAVTEYVAPGSAIEEILAEIWAELLGVDRVGVHDDFFALGGHSLLLVRLLAQVRDTFGVQLGARSVFDAPTLGGLASLVVDEMVRQAGDEVLEEVMAEA